MFGNWKWWRGQTRGQLDLLSVKTLATSAGLQVASNALFRTAKIREQYTPRIPSSSASSAVGAAFSVSEYQAIHRPNINRERQ